MKLWKQPWRRIAAALVVCLGLGAVITGVVIGHQVRRAVAAAQASEPGDPVEALLAVATSPRYDVAVRDRAVWALGQLGDDRALASLTELAAGADCDHTNGLCRYGLDKAVALCAGAPNPAATIWRHGALARR
jgi:HEAT repeat protein